MAKTFTSASAGKYLKALEDRKSYLLKMERQGNIYRCGIGEEPEPPAYDYRSTRDDIESINAEVLAIRHALHVFNNSTMLPKCGLTIDEALIKLAMLGRERDAVSSMRGIPEKKRVSSGRWGSGSDIEHEYANFDPEEVSRDYLALSAEMSNLQLEIDLANQTNTFEVDV